MSGDEIAECVGPGMQITFDGGNRLIRVWRERNGGFLWEFHRDGTITPLWLSQDAMNVMLELHHRLSWVLPIPDKSEPAP